MVRISHPVTIFSLPCISIKLTMYVHCLTSPAGLDYSAITTTLTFSVSMATQVVTIPITDDLIVENRESFTVALATNDRAVTLRFQTGISIEFTLCAHCLISPAGSEYDTVTITLTFNISMPTQVITIPIHEDLIVEDPESFTVALATNDTAVTLRLQNATVSIGDNDSKLQLYSLY